MRRLTSVLVASKRSDKSDASTCPPSAYDPPRHHLSQKRSRVFRSLSRKHLSSIDPPSPPPLMASDLTNSSSCSSSGSTALRTPDDDGLPRTSNKKSTWKSWLGGKNAGNGDHPEEHHPSHWQLSQSILPLNSGSNETDDAFVQFNDLYGILDGIPAPSHSVQQVATARVNARILIMNSLVHEPTSPPLSQLSGAISFPRSCHNYSHPRPRETLESELHKKSLLARLGRLSPSAESSIVPLASKQITPKSSTHRNFQEDVFPSADAVCLHSNGLANWVSRPCFEERLQLYISSDSGEIIQTQIPGSHLGVAALEFSETVELLAGTLLENDENLEDSELILPYSALNLDPPATHIKEQEIVHDSSQSKGSTVNVSPSPPRSSSLLALPKAPSSKRQPKESTTSGFATISGPVPKRGVRFADDDGKDDQIPLGYVLRIRKNKEQKARFLREERERRKRATQLSTEDGGANVPLSENRVSRVVASRQRPTRPLIALNGPSTDATSKPRQPATISQVVSEEQRLRQEAEKLEMEKLRRSREQSRKQAEEWERTYSEDLRATRARCEASRTGRPLESVSSARVSDRNHSISRDSMYNSLGRSGMQYKHAPELVFSPVSPHDGSPSSSMPATPGSQYSLSRPPSLYSTHTASSEDIRGRDGMRVSRRMSGVSDLGKAATLHPPYDPRASLNPYTWSNAPPLPAIPPIPPVPTMVNCLPLYGMDMPLLPPTPPFMMNQFGPRSHSYTGLGGQYTPHRMSTPLPRNYSSEGVNTSSRNSSPHSSGSHQRRSSDEATRMTKTLVSGSNDRRASAFVTPSQSKSQRSSWLPPEQNSTKRPSSFRPVSGVYSSGSPAPVRRRNAAP